MQNGVFLGETTFVSTSVAVVYNWHIEPAEQMM